jgi:hypothetical protein
MVQNRKESSTPHHPRREIPGSSPGLEVFGAHLFCLFFIFDMCWFGWGVAGNVKRVKAPQVSERQEAGRGNRLLGSCLSLLFPEV